MKQKYLLEKQEDNSLVIKEFGELEEGIFSLLCEESFESEGLLDALKKEKKELIAFLRTDNMFPPSSYAEKIAELVLGLFGEDSSEDNAEIIFDEVAMMATDDLEEELEGSEEELLDDLLDESEEDGFDGMDDELEGISSDSDTSQKEDEDADADLDEEI